MDISGIIQSYDSRESSSVAMTRTVMAPQYSPIQPYSEPTSNTLVASHQQVQHNLFSFSPYSTATPNGLAPAFANNYIQQRPQPHLMQSATDGSRGVSYTRNDQQTAVDKHQSRSPPIKAEPLWTAPPSIPPINSTRSKSVTTILPTDTTNANFGTEVDTLMKAIQAKSQVKPPQTSSPIAHCKSVVGAPFTPYGKNTSPGAMQTREESQIELSDADVRDGTSGQKVSKKRYHCNIKGCGKSFYQKTHLDIHVRAHTGVKPYHCKEPDCGRTFSQLGNLKTHERRHTGERPYSCEICGKRFAQRGNVRAHKIVHDQAKPYLCKLDDCGKQFTQLGNLKSHQNKFHIDTIRNLTSKFASIKDGDIINSTDKKLWEYFANLYKNSNKGIKGRGKDRKVGPHSMGLNSSMRNLGVGGSGYCMDGAGRRSMVVGVMGSGMKAEGAGRGPLRYEMFDADDASQARSHSGRSSVATCFDEAPPVGFENTGRNGEIAFGDSIY